MAGNNQTSTQVRTTNARTKQTSKGRSIQPNFDADSLDGLTALRSMMDVPVTATPVAKSRASAMDLSFKPKKANKAPKLESIQELDLTPLQHAPAQQPRTFDPEVYQAKMMARVYETYHKDIAGQTTTNSRIFQWIMRNDPRCSAALNHSLMQPPRTTPDPASKVDAWRYRFKDPGSGKILESDTPLSTQPEFRKLRHEARVLSLTFYGSGQKYIDGLKDYLKSFDEIKKVNGIPEDQMFGMDTFTVRTYVPERRPVPNDTREPIKPETSPEFIDYLLDRGVEVVSVDTGRDKVGRDAPFHRFMVLGETTPDGVPLRYIMRDADHKISAAETFAVGEWIRSGQRFHRLHVHSLDVGPLTASIFGGVHADGQQMDNMQERIENFPYRDIYGDDEIFTKNVIWRHMKDQGDILTHTIKQGVAHKMSNPYPKSSERPTRKYVDAFHEELASRGEQAAGPNNAHDVYMPKSLKFPQLQLAYDRPLAEIRPFMHIPQNEPRVQLAIEAYTNPNIQRIPNDLYAHYERFSRKGHLADSVLSGLRDFARVKRAKSRDRRNSKSK